MPIAAERCNSSLLSSFLADGKTGRSDGTSSDLCFITMSIAWYGMQGD